MGCHFLLKAVFLTQGSNLSLLHCKWIIYQWALREARKRMDFCKRNI